MSQERRDLRFPCVGIDLMYSPLKEDCVEGMGGQIYQAVSHDMSFSGLSFDVVHELPIGETVVVMVANQFQPNEQLMGEVRWCRPLESGLFRIGLRITAVNSTVDALKPGELEYVAADGVAMPSGADLLCPACLQKATFTLVGSQSGGWSSGVLPFYACSVCTTTRTIPNILQFNRRHYLSELNSGRKVFVEGDSGESLRKLTRILYTEDDPDIATVASMALEMVGGFVVEICSSGQEALERAEAFAPDLFLLDMMMPGMTGMQTLELLRQKPALSAVPAIFMTAKVQVHEIEGYKRPGVLGVIPKPFDPMALSNDINRIWQTQFSVGK